MDSAEKYWTMTINVRFVREASACVYSCFTSLILLLQLLPCFTKQTISGMNRLHLHTASPPTSAPLPLPAHDVITHRKFLIKLVGAETKQRWKGDKCQAALMRLWDGRWNKPGQKIRSSQKELHCLFFLYFVLHDSHPPYPGSSKLHEKWHIQLVSHSAAVEVERNFPLLLTLQHNSKLVEWRLSPSPTAREEFGWKWKKKNPVSSA